MRKPIAIALFALTACNGQLIVDLDATPCTTSADCNNGECISGTCVGQIGGGDPGDGDSGPGDNGDGPDGTLETGETCGLAADCLGGRCDEFDDEFLCTETCTSECPSEFVCFDGICAPTDFCEEETGIGDGPGCEGSPCASCGPDEQCSPSFNGGFACLCRDGLVRVDGVCESDPCSPNPCQNNGFCQTITGFDGAVCACADITGDGSPDFTGDFCENAVPRCPADPLDNPCLNGSECVDLLAGSACLCTPGFTGENCGVDIDDCDPDLCLNGSTCVDMVNGFDCECIGDFIGDLCEVEAGETCADLDPCENGGVCDDSGSTITCDCSGTGFTGDFCGVNIDDCAGDPCENGSVCQDLINDYSCAPCPLGFSGKNCDQLAPCNNDLECNTGQFCDTGTCADDTCDPAEERRCEGQSVVQCAPNGSTREVLFTCSARFTQQGISAFDSTCVTPDTGDAYCTCQDDWDCPANTECNVDQCVGTGQLATCRLPAEPFSNVLPSNEITWGAPSITERLAPKGTPFREFTQVVMTPTVANLDDDNGDGLIDERDFPEIVFLTFCWKPGDAQSAPDFTRDGVLRVIHGGGPEKGEDHLAVCGNQVWRDDGTGVSDEATCVCNRGDDDGSADDIPNFDPTMSPAVADLDGDGTPEIIVLDERDYLEVYDNRGTLLVRDPRRQNNVGNGAVTVANIDNDGFAEIIVGRNVNFLSVNGNNWAFTDYFRGFNMRGGLSQGPAACVADVTGDERMEIVAGGTLYRVPEPPPGVSMQSECSGSYTGDAEKYCDEDLIAIWNTDREGFCSVADVYGANGEPVGPSNSFDGVPEIVLIGEADGETGNNGGGRLVVISNTGTVLDEYDYRGDPSLSVLDLGTRGGAPNVDDFDGDGFPEAGTAFSAGYALVDFQAPTAACPQWPERLESDPAVIAGDMSDPNPDRSPQQVVDGCSTDNECEALVPGTACNEQTGECICLHNSWIRRTEDDSSRLTGSSVFDFNGDGAAEVIYNDECEFRVYDGLTGNVLFNEPSESRTRIEYPIVADVDNDGNAEIVFGTSNESGFCSDNQDSFYNAGVEVWGDAGDFWVSARRQWNQHAYHVTNITENTQVPLYEPKGWLYDEALFDETKGRNYNTYRSNPRNFGVAPDLEVTRVQVVGSGGGCGASLGASGEFVSQISNIGDLRVGPDVVIGFEGNFGAGFVTLLNASGDALITTVQNTLEPRDSVFLSIAYDAAWNGESSLPIEVRVTVDASYDPMSGTISFDGGRERECDESNNDRVETVAGGGAVADLVVSDVQVGQCVSTPIPTIDVRIDNQGTEAASNVLVRLYAGDPNQGGSPIGEQLIPASLPAGSSNTLVSITPATFPFCAPVRIFAVVDPDNAVEECNDGNNLGGQSGSTFCCFDSGG